MTLTAAVHVVRPAPFPCPSPVSQRMPCACARSVAARATPRACATLLRPFFCIVGRVGQGRWAPGQGVQRPSRPYCAPRLALGRAACSRSLARARPARSHGLALGRPARSSGVRSGPCSLRRCAVSAQTVRDLPHASPLPPPQAPRARSKRTGQCLWCAAADTGGCVFGVGGNVGRNAFPCCVRTAPAVRYSPRGSYRMSVGHPYPRHPVVLSARPGVTSPGAAFASRSVRPASALEGDDRAAPPPVSPPPADRAARVDAMSVPAGCSASSADEPTPGSGVKVSYPRRIMPWSWLVSWRVAAALPSRGRANCARVAPVHTRWATLARTRVPCARFFHAPHPPPRRPPPSPSLCTAHAARFADPPPLPASLPAPLPASLPASLPAPPACLPACHLACARGPQPRLTMAMRRCSSLTGDEQVYLTDAERVVLISCFDAPEAPLDPVTCVVATPSSSPCSPHPAPSAHPAAVTANPSLRPSATHSATIAPLTTAVTPLSWPRLVPLLHIEAASPPGPILRGLCPCVIPAPACLALHRVRPCRCQREACGPPQQ